MPWPTRLFVFSCLRGPGRDWAMKLLTIVSVLGFTVAAAAQPPADLSRQSAGGATADLSRQSAAGATADWPQWQGPDRTGLSKETGLLKSWPAGGPPKIWSISALGEGYGSLAIEGDRIFVQGVNSGSSSVFCLDRANGSTIWTKAMSARLDQDRGAGP